MGLHNHSRWVTQHVIIESLKVGQVTWDYTITQSGSLDVGLLGH